MDALTFDDYADAMLAGAALSDEHILGNDLTLEVKIMSWDVVGEREASDEDDCSTTYVEPAEYEVTRCSTCARGDLVLGLHLAHYYRHGDYVSTGAWRNLLLGLAGNYVHGQEIDTWEDDSMTRGEFNIALDDYGFHVPHGPHPGLLSRLVRCPVPGCRMHEESTDESGRVYYRYAIMVIDMIPHLNDSDHGWSSTEIAAWLRSLGFPGEVQ